MYVKHCWLGFGSYGSCIFSLILFLIQPHFFHLINAEPSAWFFSGAKVFTGSLGKSRSGPVGVLKKISTLRGSIFFKNLDFPEPYLFMLPKQNQHTPALYTNKKNVRYENQSIK